MDNFIDLESLEHLQGENNNNIELDNAIPFLNIPYNAEYSTTIEYNTTITDLSEGYEQRYPVMTYPKRIFKLSMDNNATGRQALEDFFNETQGAYGQFNFIWSAANGGDGLTYLCNLDTDELMQQIHEYGFSSGVELKLVCIDDKAIGTPGELDFYHSAESQYNTFFYTLQDKIYTSMNSRRSMWQRPKKSWRLTFDLTPTNRKRFEAFFKTKRGKFKAFDWTWNSSKGGDDNTYLVRFDTDSLEMKILEGYSTFDITIVEVFRPVSYANELESDEIIPRKLLKVELAGGSVYIIDNETLSTFSFNGEDYLGAPLDIGDITKDDNVQVHQLDVTLSNVNQAFSGIIANRGDVITGANAELYIVFLNTSTNEVLTQYTKLLFAGKCDKINLDLESASMVIVSNLAGYDVSLPKMKHYVNCQYAQFKDVRCGYTGSQTTCDRTLDTCVRYGNVNNFGGFPTITKELIIKA